MKEQWSFKVASLHGRISLKFSNMGILYARSGHITPNFCQKCIVPVPQVVKIPCFFQAEFWFFSRVFFLEGFFTSFFHFFPFFSKPPNHRPYVKVRLAPPPGSDRRPSRSGQSPLGNGSARGWATSGHILQVYLHTFFYKVLHPFFPSWHHK